jgi:MOSC domain-containing protein YiiM
MRTRRRDESPEVLPPNHPYGGRVVSVNVGRVREQTGSEKTYETGIDKVPAKGRVTIQGVHVGSDEQADGANHGGPEKVALAYAAADYRYWEERLGRGFSPGTFGENLTVEGIDCNTALIGELWQAGTTVLEVTGPPHPLLQARR